MKELTTEGSALKTGFISSENIASSLNRHHLEDIAGDYFRWAGVVINGVIKANETNH